MVRCFALKFCLKSILIIAEFFCHFFRCEVNVAGYIKKIIGDKSITKVSAKRLFSTT